MGEEKDIKFVLKKITTEQFATMEDDFQEDKDQIGLSSGVKFGLDSDNKAIAVFTKFTFDQDNIPFLLIETACHFSIDDESWERFLDKKTNKMKFPKGFAIHLTVLTVGTARGVLHAKTENTVFNRFVLPTINVNTIIKNDVVF